VGSKDLLEKFISFILLLSLPKNRSALSGNSAHTEEVTAALLPLTQFLKAVLERVRTHELLLTRSPRREGLVFRIGTAQQISGKGGEQDHCWRKEIFNG
jgi:hypothetical protein